MADEGRTSQPESSIHVNHYCCIEGCGQFGEFGFARTRAEPVTWWCYEHYPQWDEIKRNARSSTLSR